MPRQSGPPAAAVVPQRVDNPKAQYDNVMATLEHERDKLVRMLGAVHVSPERFLSVVDQALRRSPGLLECTPSSIVKALLDAAELGLMPSGLVGQAYLVPYRNRHTGRKEAQLIPGYRGLIDLVRRSGELRSIEARVVRENDEFEIVFGTNGLVRHVPYINRHGETIEEALDSAKPDEISVRVKDGGRYIGAYMIANLADAGVQVEWMSTAEVEQVRRRSKAQGDSPWVTDWSEMAKKTVTRRGIKYLPIAIDSPVNRALALEDAAEQNAANVKVVSEGRQRLEAALGIVGAPENGTVAGADEAEGVSVPPDEDGAVCGLPDAEGNPCLKVPDHLVEGSSHESALYVWPSTAVME